MESKKKEWASLTISVISLIVSILTSCFVGYSSFVDSLSEDESSYEEANFKIEEALNNININTASYSKYIKKNNYDTNENKFSNIEKLDKEKIKIMNQNYKDNIKIIKEEYLKMKKIQNRNTNNLLRKKFFPLNVEKIEPLVNYEVSYAEKIDDYLNIHMENILEQKDEKKIKSDINDMIKKFQEDYPHQE